MIDNIFENAKFGDKFVTRDGRTAIFWHKDVHKYGYSEDTYNLIVEDELTALVCLPNGLNLGSDGSWEDDIVSEKLSAFDREILRTILYAEGGEE